MAIKNQLPNRLIMQTRLLIFFFSLMIGQTLSAQKNAALVSGPMLGYVEHREVLLWLEVAPTVKKVAIRYHKINEPKNTQTIKYTGRLGQTYNPLKIVIGDLNMGTTYQYEVLLDKKAQKTPYPLQFSTKKLWEWRQSAPDFSFLMGSCAYVNDSIYDRPGKPYGQATDILANMAKQPSDFMLWLGDNLYLREADYSSVSGIRYRNQHVRKQPYLQALFASRPNYAIWDDHDFGPNDSNQTYELRDSSLQIFKDYWGNKSYGETDNKGTYGKFQWSDCEFFLLDDRYHRSPEGLPNTDMQKQYLGAEQLDWLKQSLLSSRATFKFVASGSQMLNALNTFECFRNYEREWNSLMDFIVANKISGVVFLTGDRHFTEVIAYQPAGGYPLYDITSSPLTSSPYTKVAESKEGKNENRVEGTIFADQNYMKLSVIGDKKQRALKIQTFDANNVEQWVKTFLAKDLIFAK